MIRSCFLASVAVPCLLSLPTAAQTGDAGNILVTATPTITVLESGVFYNNGVAGATSEIFDPGIGQAVCGGLRTRW